MKILSYFRNQKKNKEKVSILDVSNYFLMKGENETQKIPLLKLQKIVYYAQAWYLAFNEGRRLFSEPMIAWVHGPTNLKLYRLYRDYGMYGIPAPNKLHRMPIRIKQFLDEIWEIYGDQHHLYLEDIVHREEPWIDNFQKGSGEIKYTLLKKKPPEFIQGVFKRFFERKSYDSLCFHSNAIR